MPRLVRKEGFVFRNFFVTFSLRTVCCLSSSSSLIAASLKRGLGLLALPVFTQSPLMPPPSEASAALVVVMAPTVVAAAAVAAAAAAGHSAKAGWKWLLESAGDVTAKSTIDGNGWQLAHVSQLSKLAKSDGLWRCRCCKLLLLLLQSPCWIGCISIAFQEAAPHGDFTETSFITAGWRSNSLNSYRSARVDVRKGLWWSGDVFFSDGAIFFTGRGRGW